MTATLVQMDGLNMMSELDTNQYNEMTASEACAPEDIPAPEDMEYAPVSHMHPLAVATRQLEILQHHLFLAGSAGSVQTHSNDDCQPAAANDTGPYCRLACDVLSCAVSACELWRDSLLQHGAVPAANASTPVLSTMELSRLLSSLISAMHILDCLKDTKQSLRAALMSVTAQEGDEQQLLVAVQDFFGMPAACVVLLRDLLLEDSSTLTLAKRALLRLLPLQLYAVESSGSQAHHDHAADRSGTKRGGSLKSKFGLMGSHGGHGAESGSGGGAGAGGTGGASIAARSATRIGLSLLVYLYCCVDTAEQEQQATHSQTGADSANAKAAAATTYKLLRSCVAALRTTPVVPGYGDVPVDLLRPLQGLSQLTCGPAWEGSAGGGLYPHPAAAEERYSLSTVSAAAARDYGRLVEDLLALKLQHESSSAGNPLLQQPCSNPSTPTAIVAPTAGTVSSKNPSVSSGPAPSKVGSTHGSVQALSQAVGTLAGRAIQLLQDWQAAVLLLDAFRTWQRQQRLQRLEEERQGASGGVCGGEEGTAPSATGGSDAASSTLLGPLPRSAFTASDLPDVVRIVSYIKGLYGILNDSMPWLEPLLKAHCAGHLKQLATTVVAPVAHVAQGVAHALPGGGADLAAAHALHNKMGAAGAGAGGDQQRFSSQHQLMPPQQQQQHQGFFMSLAPRSAREGYPLSAPSSARAIAPGLTFGATNTTAINTHHANGHINSGHLTGPLPTASPRVDHAPGSADAPGTTDGAAAGNNLVLGLGRIWKAKTASHGRHNSTIPAAAAASNNAPATAGPNDALGLGLRPLPVSAPPAMPIPAESGITVTGTMMSQRTTEDSADTCNLIASITADAADWPPSKSPDVRSSNDPYSRLREWFASGNNPNAMVGIDESSLPTDRNAPLQSVPEGPTPRSDVAATSASISHRAPATPQSGGVAGASGGAGGADMSPSVHCDGSYSPNNGADGSCMSATLHKARGEGAMQHAGNTEGTEDGVECTVSSVSDAVGGGGMGGDGRDETGAEHDDEEDEVEGAAWDARGATSAGKNYRTLQQQGSAVRRRLSGSVSASVEMAWPEIPSASWLNGSTSATTPKAGNGSCGGSTPAAAVLARVTPPAAISTNPLYVYPSAAEEKVAEQERATVAILIASEGGSMGAAAAALAGQDQHLLAAAAAATAATTAADSVCEEDQMQQRQDQSVYMDELNCSMDMGTGAMHHLYQDVADQHALQQQQQAIYDDNAAEEADAAAADDGALNEHGAAFAGEEVVAHGGINPTDQQQQPQQQPQANNESKKRAAAPFWRFKKLFGKRNSNGGGDKTSASAAQPNAIVPHAGAGAPAAGYDELATAAVAHDPAFDAFYGGGDYPPALGAAGGFGMLPATYLAFQHDMAAPPLDSASAGLPNDMMSMGLGTMPFMIGAPGMLPNLYAAPPSPGHSHHHHMGALHHTLHGATQHQLPAGFRQSMASSEWAGLVTEAAAQDGAVAVLSVEGGGGADLPVGAPYMHQALLSQGSVGEPELTLMVPGGGVEQQGASGTPRAGDGAAAAASVGEPVGGATAAQGAVGKGAGGGLAGLLGGGSAAYMDVVIKAREQNSCQKLRQLASEIQMCLMSAGFTAGSDGTRTAATAMTQPAAAGRKGPGGKGKAGLKRFVTSLKAKSSGRSSSDTGGPEQAGGQALDAAWEAAPGSDFVGLDRQGAARLRNAAELMAAELETMAAQRRARGKSAKDGGPSLVQLLALSAELRVFLTSDLPSLEPLLAFRTHLAAAADLSSLLLLDPSRPYAGSVDGRLAADSRGSVPWELASKGVLGQGLQGMAAKGSAQISSSEVPLTAALTMLALFADVTEAVQAQQACCTFAGYPEPPMAERMVLLFRRQARWCLNNFVHSAARSVWATFKAQAIRWELGMSVPSGAGDVAPSTAAFHGFFQLPREEPALLRMQQLTGFGTEPRLPPELSITDMLSAAIEDLVRQAACRTASLLLGSDLTALVAVKQQLDVLSLAVSRLRRDLPTIRPWNDTWLAALAARAAASPTCTAIAEAAAATAATVTQGCISGGAGALVTVEEIILTHVCSPGVLRALSMWSYDMIGVRFRHTKHTKSFWDGLTGANKSPESPRSVHYRDGADATLESAAAAVMAAAGLLGPTPGSGRRSSKDGGGRSSSGGSGGAQGCVEWPVFGREHVVAMHGLLGLSGVGRWVGSLRQHAAELLTEAAPMLRRVHDLYDSSVAGPRGPGMRGTGGASGYLQLQQRWLRDRGHSELLVSANRVLQALGNTVATVALTDSVLAELCVGRAPHLLPLAATALQADQQAHSVIKAMALSAAEPGSSMLVGKPQGSAAAAVPPPPHGTGLAGVLLGQPLPPGLVTSDQPAVQAAALVQERLTEQLPPTFGLPGLWRALHECLHPPATPDTAAAGPQQPQSRAQQYQQQQQRQLDLQAQQPFAAARLWSVLQVQLSCLSSEEQSVHAANVGDGVYVAAAAMVQLAANAAVAPGSVLPGDTMTLLQQAAALEELKAELAVATAGGGGVAVQTAAQTAAAATAQATLEQLKMWAVRAQSVRAAWDRAVQLTVGSGTAAARLAAERRKPESSSSSSATRKALDMPPLTTRSAVPWVSLAHQMAAVGAALLMRVAAAAAAPQQQQQHPHSSSALQMASGPGMGAGSGAGLRMHSALPLGRPSSHNGVSGAQQMGAPHGRSAPPRPPQPHPSSSAAAGAPTAHPTAAGAAAPTGAAPGAPNGAAALRASVASAASSGPALPRTGSASFSQLPVGSGQPSNASAAPNAANMAGAAAGGVAAGQGAPRHVRSATADGSTLQQHQQTQQQQNLQPHQHHQQTLQQLRAASHVLLKASPRAGGAGGAGGVAGGAAGGDGSSSMGALASAAGPYGTYGTFGAMPAGSTAAQSRSRAGSSLADWGQLE